MPAHQSYTVFIDIFIDNNHDGLSDSVALLINPPDTDGDSIPDYLDLDSDGDSISDFSETSTANHLDADSNGVIDNFVDLNADGWIDNHVIALFDGNANGIADFRDIENIRVRRDVGEEPDSTDETPVVNDDTAPETATISFLGVDSLIGSTGFPFLLLLLSTLILLRYRTRTTLGFNAIVLLALFSFSPTAESHLKTYLMDSPYWYLGGGTGLSRVGPISGAEWSPSEAGNQLSGYGFLGHRFLPHIFWELTYLQ